VLDSVALSVGSELHHELNRLADAIDGLVFREREFDVNFGRRGSLTADNSDKEEKREESGNHAPQITPEEQILERAGMYC
jgi:hypothetical protein